MSDIDRSYQKPLPGESSAAYWQRMTNYEREHGIQPSDGDLWPTPHRVSSNVQKLGVDARLGAVEDDGEHPAGYGHGV